MEYSTSFVEVMLKRNPTLKNLVSQVSPANIVELYKQYLRETDMSLSFAWVCIPSECNRIIECLRLIESSCQSVGQTKSPTNDMSMMSINTYSFYRTVYSQMGQCDSPVICNISTATGIVIRLR